MISGAAWGVLSPWAMVARAGLQPQTAWFDPSGFTTSLYGLDAFLNPDQQQLRRDELKQLSGGINGSGIQPREAEQLANLLRTLRMMPPEDRLTLLAMLNPQIRQQLANTIARANMGGQPMSSPSSGGGPASGGGGAPAYAPAARGPARGPSPGGAPSAPRGAPSASGPAPVGPAPGGTATGQRLAQTAAQVAGARNTTGWCFAGVAESVRKSMGVSLSGASAYMAADQLAASPRFKETQVSPEQLRNLPPGAVVVWGQTSQSPHGHISVALGDGREASDHIQQQMTSLRGSTNYRVFIPQ